MAIESTKEEREKETRSLYFQGDEGRVSEKQRVIGNGKFQIFFQLMKARKPKIISLGFSSTGVENKT